MTQHWLKLAQRRLLPIVQGGMGIGISAHRLAGTVAANQGMGTIASIDLRHHHPDLMAQTRGSRDKAQIEAANRLFGPSEAELAEARAIIAAFEAPENAGKGVLTVQGKMTERLHYEMARRTVALAG